MSESSNFFEGSSKLHQTLLELKKRLDELNVRTLSSVAWR